MLGVLLFLLYINDISEVLMHSKIALFADDALVYCDSNDADECIRNIQTDLNNIEKWLKMSKLKLNVDKTKFMKTNINRQVVLKADGKEIEEVNEFKYLGVWLDVNLKLNKNGDYVCGKIAKKIGFVSRIRRFISRKTAIMLYNALVLPHFDYCSTMLFAATNAIKYRLQLLQNKGMRLILKKSRRTNIKLMLNQLKWMSVNQRLIYNSMIFVFKLKNGIVPEYLKRANSTVRESQPYNLRGADKFRLMKMGRSVSQSMVMYKGLQLFNDLPDYIRLVQNMNKFKRLIREYVLNKFD